MDWSVFYIVVSGLITFVLLVVALPWLKRKNHAKVDSLSNTQIVKQRIHELEREVAEGLISADDKQSAVNELKLALVDESEFTATAKGGALLPLIIGGVIAAVAGITVYVKVNQLEGVSRASDAIAALPQLSQQLASGQSNDLTQQDITDLVLAIRQRLRETPSDHKGWMYLGRLWMSLGQGQQAIEAISRASQLAPDDEGYRISLAQALMTAGDESSLEQAQGLMAKLLDSQPQNDNLALMMTVVSAQLGDLANTERYFAKISDKLPESSEVKQRLVERIASLKQQSSLLLATGEQAEMPLNEMAKTGFNVTINLSEDVADKLPNQGYVIVFAQDDLSANRMPAAVVKLPLGRFPLTVTLTTDNAMMPQYTLDMLTQTKLTARVSVDGDVSASSGDIEGSVSTAIASNEVIDINLVINREIP